MKINDIDYYERGNANICLFSKLPIYVIDNLRIIHMYGHEMAWPK